MGVDLTLLPEDLRFNNSGSAHTLLPLERDSALQDLVVQANPYRIQGYKFTSYKSSIPDGSLKGESCYGEIVDDGYGDPITFLNLDDLCGAFERREALVEEGVPAQPSKNLAVWAWLKTIDPRVVSKVALYWC